MLSLLSVRCSQACTRQPEHLLCSVNCAQAAKPFPECCSFRQRQSRFSLLDCLLCLPFALLQCAMFLGWITGMHPPGKILSCITAGQVLMHKLQAHCEAYEAIKRTPIGRGLQVGEVNTMWHAASLLYVCECRLVDTRMAQTLAVPSQLNQFRTHEECHKPCCSWICQDGFAIGCPGCTDGWAILLRCHASLLGSTMKYTSWFDVAAGGGAAAGGAQQQRTHTTVVCWGCCFSAATSTYYS